MSQKYDILILTNLFLKSNYCQNLFFIYTWDIRPDAYVTMKEGTTFEIINFIYER
jgi:hypothetical protein